MTDFVVGETYYRVRHSKGYVLEDSPLLDSHREDISRLKALFSERDDLISRLRVAKWELSQHSDISYLPYVYQPHYSRVVVLKTPWRFGPWVFGKTMIKENGFVVPVNPECLFPVEDLDAVMTRQETGLAEDIQEEIKKLFLQVSEDLANLWALSKSAAISEIQSLVDLGWSLGFHFVNREWTQQVELYHPSDRTLLLVNFVNPDIEQLRQHLR